MTDAEAADELIEALHRAVDGAHPGDTFQAYQINDEVFLEFSEHVLDLCQERMAQRYRDLDPEDDADDEDVWGTLRLFVAMGLVAGIQLERDRRRAAVG